jgi:magnesium-transporting ATPase (P-type)
MVFWVLDSVAMVAHCVQKCNTHAEEIRIALTCEIGFELDNKICIGSKSINTKLFQEEIFIIPKINTTPSDKYKQSLRTVVCSGAPTTFKMGGPEETKPSVEQKTTYTDEHTMPLDDLAKKLETDFNSGLTTEEAKSRLERDGPNALTPPVRTPKWVKFLKIMFGGFAALLWAGAVLCFVAVTVEWFNNDKFDKDNMMIGVALVIVNICTGAFTYYQENKSDKIMESFASMIPPKDK